MIKSPQDLAEQLDALAATCQSQIDQIRACGNGPAEGAPKSSELVFQTVRDSLNELAAELNPARTNSILENARRDGFPNVAR